MMIATVLDINASTRTDYVGIEEGELRNVRSQETTPLNRRARSPPSDSFCVLVESTLEVFCCYMAGEIRGYCLHSCQLLIQF